MRSQNKGFTLLETAVVLLIAAMLLAGVMVGGRVVRQAEINTIVEETETIQRAFDSFIKSYNALPGDIANATDKFGTTLGSYTILNGDGDGQYNTTASSVVESNVILQHLAAAGLIAGTYNDDISAYPFTGAMHSATNDKLLYVFNVVGGELYLTLSGHDGSALTDTAFSPQEAYNIDHKYDDGYASTGNIISEASGGGGVGDCTDGVNYTLTNSGLACTMFIKLNLKGFHTTTDRAAVVATAGCPNGTATPSAVAATRTVRNCYTEFGLGGSSKTITEECMTGGYWAVQTSPAQTCP